MGKCIFFLTLSLFFVLAIALCSYAEEEAPAYSLGEIVITATKVPVEKEYISDAVTVITAEDIGESQASSLYQALEGQTGLDVQHAGGPGQFTTIRLRGGKNSDIAVLFNGVRLYDPTNISNDFGDLWSFLGLDAVDRIEIVEGPQSSLYGANAMSGVIQVLTQKGGGPNEASASAEYGKFGSIKDNAKIKGSLGQLGYFISYQGINADGIYKDDKWRNTNFDSNLNIAPFSEATQQILKSINFDLNLHYTDALQNFPHWDYLSFKAFNDPDNTRKENLWANSLKISGAPANWWDFSLIFAYNYTKRAFEDKDNGVIALTKDGTEIFDWPSDTIFTGKTYPIIFQNNLYLKKLATLVLGAEYYGEDGTFEDKSPWGSNFQDYIHTYAYYTNLMVSLLDQRLNIALGGRIDDHETFGAHGTWKTGASYKLPYGFRLKGNLATGFKAPSLYNLFDPTYGNPELNPEKSAGGDIGIEQSLFREKIFWEAFYFNTHFKERINFNFATMKYFNVGTANVSGFETRVKYNPLKWLRISANYTYTEGQEGGEEALAGVSRHKAGVKAGIVQDKWDINIYYQFVGERPGYDFLEEHYTADFSRVDITGSYRINKNLELYGRVENLFDVDYELMKGYRYPGFSAYAGIRLKAF